MSYTDLGWSEFPDGEPDDVTTPDQPCMAEFTIPIAGREVRIVLHDTDDVELTCRVEAMVQHFLAHETNDEPLLLDD